MSKQNKRKLLLVILIAILIIIGIFFINDIAQSVNANAQSKIGKEIKLSNSIKKELYEKVKKDITDSLKTPSTAVFPKMKEWNIRVNSNNVIEVKSYVDSQNSFGAMLRADFEQKYIILNKDDYLCIYKEFDNETEFDITEETEYKKFINDKAYDFQIEEFIEESKNATIYGNLTDYNYDKENQNLEIKLTVKKIDSPYFTYRDCLNGVICTYINQCICIPTVNTKLNIKDEKGETIATVNNINFEFLINEWYTLCKLEIVDNTDGTNLEEKLQDRLWISEKINNK